jgi:hypothetical protein
MQPDESYNFLCSRSHLNLRGQQSSLPPPFHPRILNNEYTDNYIVKSILTNLSLFCKSNLAQTVLQIDIAQTVRQIDLAQTVLQIFYVSSCSTILHFVLSCSAIMLYVPFHSAHMLTFLPRILCCILSYCLIPFPSIIANLPQSVSSSFMHTSPTVPLLLPSAKTRTLVLATEMLTDSSSCVCFS